MHHTHFKGMVGELEFTLSLIHKGFTVLKPINQNSGYDLVIEKDSKFSRIQIKYCTPNKNGILRVELGRPMRKTKPYVEREVDAMGVYNSRDQKCYLIPINSTKNKREIWLRTEITKNGRMKHIHLASEFELE